MSDFCQDPKEPGIVLITGENDKDRRLDRVLRKALSRHPLPLIHRLLRQGKVFVNGKPAKAQTRLDAGVKITIPSIKDIEKPATAARPRISQKSLPKPEILWQGAGLIAVNKPSGLEVHGKNSLDTIVRAYLAEKTTHSLSFTPGPLHRLDKPSSGIVIFSTNIEGAHLFSSLLRERKVKKTYLAILEGKIDKEQIWEDTLFRDKEKKKTFVAENGKDAITVIKPLAAENGYSLVTAEIATGRTHQIRTQAAFHGHPLAGDKKYGGIELKVRGSSVCVGGFFLHAWKLEFLDIAIEAPPPSAFAEMFKNFSF